MEVITVLTGGAGFEDAAEYLPYVSALRRDRIARKRSGSDKLLSLTAGLLISLEVTRRTGIPRGSIRYVHGAFGKPYLDGSTLQFSLSHTKGAVCAVFSDGESGEVGVDIERRDRRVSERIRERHTKRERKAAGKLHGGSAAAVGSEGSVPEAVGHWNCGRPARCGYHAHAGYRSAVLRGVPRWCFRQGSRSGSG